MTPSEGFAPERQASSEADIFRITLDPGAIVTFVAELSDPQLPEIHLWRPDAYKSMVNSYTLYRGMVLGIAGLLALFLSVLFVVKGTAMFPATAALAWAVLRLHLASTSASGTASSKARAGHMADVARRHGGVARRVRCSSSSTPISTSTAGTSATATSPSAGWSAWRSSLGVIAIDPSVAAGIARISIGLTAVVGFGVIVYLAIHGYDRAIMLIPTWLMLLFWVFAAWLAVTGRIDHASCSRRSPAAWC